MFRDCRYWDIESIFNPQKIHIYGGILEVKIAGHVSLKQNITGVVFVDLFDNTIELLIVEALRD